MHSWRELASEIGVIVIGVLIAISFEQAVEWFHWRHETAETEAALRAELSLNVRALDRSRRVFECTDRRLARLEQWADGTRPFDAARLDDPGNMPYFPRIQQTVWEVSKSGAAVAHLPLERRMRYARAYDQLENLRANWLQREYTAWHEIARYAGKPARLSAEDGRRLKEEVRFIRAMFLSRREQLTGGPRLIAQTAGLAATAPEPAEDGKTAALLLCQN